MARRLFFVPEVRRGLAELTGTDAEHLVRVLRAEPGEVYEISDDRRAYLAKIQTARKSSVVFQVMEELPPEPERPSICLFPALFKFDRFEWMIEKATELGVARIEPFSAIRSERGLAQAAIKRVERWKRIAVEASQQSRRKRLPRLMFTPSAPSRYVIKQQPHPACLSTLEAAHEVLLALERAGLDAYPQPEQLPALFARMQAFQLRCASDPAREGYRHHAYRPPAERKAPSGRSGTRRTKMFEALR